MYEMADSHSYVSQLFETSREHAATILSGALTTGVRLCLHAPSMHRRTIASRPVRIGI